MGTEKAFYTIKFTYFSPAGVGRYNFDMVNTRIHSVQSKKKKNFNFQVTFQDYTWTF